MSNFNHNAVSSVVTAKKDKMIDVLNNPFFNSSFQSSRKTVVGQSNVAVSVPSSSSVALSRNSKDEYIPSLSSSSVSGTYKHSSISTAIPLNPNAATGGTRNVEITDAMREEVKETGGAMSLLSVAAITSNKIFRQVLDEKGVVSLDGGIEFYAKHSISSRINLDGIFIFNPEESFIEGFDEEAVKDVCLALESAYNSSSFNMEENPHFFMRHYLPQEYDPSKWGRTIDKEEWNLNLKPDFSEFMKELRSDISNLFGDLQIADFSIKINDKGELTVFDVKTVGSNSKTNAQITEQINSQFTYEIKKKAEYLGLLMFSQHGYEEGDVLREGMLEPFDDGSRGNIRLVKHEVIITSDTTYKVVPVGE
ncbi:MAG: hypothetical protein LBT09_07200 [Planctomycetaceae bacterium]|jgi:hypothetical protein|nr:hypothetical protein [Planctomycetaceae bacterium]